MHPISYRRSISVMAGPGTSSDQLTTCGSPGRNSTGSSSRALLASHSAIESWDEEGRPHVNQVGELVLDGRTATFRLSVTDLGQEELREVLAMPLTAG